MPKHAINKRIKFLCGFTKFCNKEETVGPR